MLTHVLPGFMFFVDGFIPFSCLHKSSIPVSSYLSLVLCLGTLGKKAAFALKYMQLTNWAQQ